MPSTSGEEMVRERAALVTFTLVTAIIGSLISSVLFVAPVPLAVLIYRHSLRSGILTALAAGGLVGVIMGHPAAMMLVLLVLGLGVAIGEALRDKLTLNQTIGFTWAVTFLSFIALYVISRMMFHTDLIEATVQIWSDQVMRLQNTPGSTPLTKAEIGQLTAELRMMLPGMMALSAAGISTLDYWLTGRWLVRMGAKIPWFPPFAHWRFSPHFTWGYLAGILLPMLATRLQAPFLVPIAVNFEVVFRFVFLIQGTAVFWFYLNRWRVRKPVGVILVALTMLVPPFPIVIGLLDTWFDLRRLRNKK